MKQAGLMLMLFCLLSCKDDLPLGFYEHQVTRLLAGGNAKDSSKTWARTRYVVDGVNRPIENCTDSVRLLFKIIQTLPKDSVNVYELTPKANCTDLDTVIYGGMTPSSTDNIFTDSLLFVGGTLNYMLVDHITSMFLTVHYESGGSKYQVDYSAVQ